MHELYELKEMLMKELEEYGKKELQDVGSLEVVDKLAHAVKNICKIIEAAEEEEGGSSYRRSMAGGESGQSRARGRGANAKRDSRGRYAREGYGSSYREGGSSYRGGSSYERGGRGGSSYRRGGSSYENSYDDGVEEMLMSIEGMMDELPQEVKKDAERFVMKLEQMM